MSLVVADLADAIRDELETELGDPAESSDTWDAVALAVARAVIEYFTANADVTVSVETTDVGLQRDPATSTDTLGPSSTRTLAGGVS